MQIGTVARFTPVHCFASLKLDSRSSGDCRATLFNAKKDRLFFHIWASFYKKISRIFVTRAAKKPAQMSSAEKLLSAVGPRPRMFQQA